MREEVRQMREEAIVPQGGSNRRGFRLDEPPYNKMDNVEEFDEFNRRLSSDDSYYHEVVSRFVVHMAYSL